ncbi:hypothetical protein [Tsukamurella pseudospumae]|uniref:Uncharacterized protein n=1 Tax=Tsukamurella pseudospumae TaxID=239498 RepID=A0A138AFP4_9ACTN|nr:hypothetical protein [Tsukamurella pseudospumae]KXP09292.1 hypothetical protein AXK60_24985 [Tsukamurella pseudospumae]
MSSSPSDFDLYGSTPEARRISAQILVKLARQEGREPDQWLLNVAEGPASDVTPEQNAALSSQEQRRIAGFDLYGSTPEARRISAQILVKLARQEGREPDQWLLDVVAGRLPA